MDELVYALIQAVGLHCVGGLIDDPPAALKLEMRKRIEGWALQKLELAAKLDEHAPAILALQAQRDVELAA